MNSVISISICFCPVLFIHLFTPIEGPMTHQNIQGGICELDGLYLSRSKLDKNVILHFTKATQTLFFHNLALNSVLFSSKPSLSFGFCIDLHLCICRYCYLLYVCESVGGAKQAAMLIFFCGGGAYPHYYIIE